MKGGKMKMRGIRIEMGGGPEPDEGGAEAEIAADVLADIEKGDPEALAESLAAFVRECMRGYGDGE